MTIISNDPTEWGRLWTTVASTGMACYPLDGRETVWEPYERIVKTDNVGDYLDALNAAFGQPHVRRYDAFPEDMLAYLQQRVPSMVVLEDLDPDSPIDRFGHVQPKQRPGVRKALDLAKVRDDEGHEHGSDGRFVSTGGGSKTLDEQQAEHEKKYGKKAGKETIPCERCGGSGYLGWVGNIDNGRCWGCAASGKQTVTIPQPKVLAAREERERAKQQDRQTETLLREYEVSQKHPELYNKLRDRAAMEFEHFTDGGHAANALNALIHHGASQETAERALRVAEQHLIDEGHLSEGDITDVTRNGKGYKRSEGELKSRHVGKPGEKMTSTVRLVRPLIPFESAYGTGFIAIMEDDEGNRLKWFTSNPYDLFGKGGDAKSYSVGEPFKADFTVKQHGRYDGVDETTILRVKPAKEKKPTHARKLADLFEPRTLLKVVDAEGHKHDDIGRFATSSGGKRASLSPTTSIGGRRFTASGDLLPEHIAKLKIPPAWTDVRYNEDPDGDLLAVGKDAKGRAQAVYSDAHWAKAAAQKFGRIEEMRNQFGKMVTENAQAQRSDNPRVKDSADCLRLIMAMGIRPGSDDDTGAEKKAYGATTLEGRHVVDEGGKLFLRFVGKKGVSLDLPVEDPEVEAMLRERKAKAEPDGKLFPATNDKALLDHTHTLDGGHFKTKDFRTLLGTSLAYSLVSAQPDCPTTMTDYKKRVLAVAKAVAKRLGNTPTVALQSYINPAVFAEWKVSE